MKLTNNKKGVIDQLQPLVVGLVAIGIVLVVGFLIMSQMAANSTVAADANASEAIDKTQSAMDSIPGWLSIIVITVIGALLLSLVALFRRS